MFEAIDYIKRRYLTPILNSRLKKSDSVYSLKNNCPFPELCTITDEISSPTNIVYKYIHGNPLPKSYDELGNLGKTDYVSSADDVTAEINWTILSVRKHKTEIQLFLEYRKMFEDAFLLGHYELAENFLNKIETEICCSLWSLEKRFLLLELSKSPEEHKSFLSDFNKANKGFFTPTLAYYISNRCEKNFSVTKYNTDIFSSMASLRGGLGEANRQFYYLRLNPFEYSNYTEYRDILSFESYNSIIDRYLTLVKVLKLIAIDKETKAELKFFCLSRAYYLIKKFDDIELLSLFASYQPELIKENSDSSFNLKILDYYTSGLYSEAIDEMQNHLLKFPSRFEYYPLYVKSFLLSGKNFQLPSDHNNIQNTILTEIYNQLNRKIDPITPATNLSRLSKNLSSFLISEGIFSFINSEVSVRDYWTKYNHFSLSFENPLFSEHYQDDKQKKDFLNSLLEKYPKSITTEFILRKLSDDFEISFEDLKIPERTKTIEIAKHYQDKSKFDKASKLWEDLIKSSKDFSPIYETSVRNLFLCYIKLNELDKAIELYVDNYLVNPFIVQKIDCNEIHEIVRKNKFKNVNPTIDLPLFYTLSYADENEIHIAYERFNRSQGVEKASLLFPKVQTFSKRKIILYFQLVCTTEIFKHSIYINGTKEGYSERIAICRQLVSLDKNNEQTYRRELNSLTDILIIQEGLQQLDESKIYVNEQGLINTELKEYEGLYDTYKTFSNIFKDDSKQLVIFAKEGIIATVDVGESKAIGEGKNKFSSHPLKDVFQDIFEVITEKFLHSKFGISAYLSTRIRHGVLLGEIRPIFEKFNLISQKDNSDKKYREVQYWNKRYSYLHVQQRAILQDELANLSEVIDNLITELIKKNLQIKTGKEHPEGWFDYLFDDTTLILYSISLNDVKNYQEFIKKVIEILWTRTDTILEEIRAKIQGEVKDKFNDALSNFTSELKSKLPHAHIPDIYTNITTCSTEVQNAIDRIASWFNRSGSQTSDFTLDKLVDIVLENINHSYQTKGLDLKKDIQANPTIKGEYYSHFADLIRIFFDNALKHSTSTITSVPTEIKISQENNWLFIEIVNEYPDLESIKGMPKIGEQKIDTKKLSTEGKSGFHKAFKIMQDDLKNENNECDLKIVDENKFCASLKIVIDNLIV